MSRQFASSEIRTRLLSVLDSLDSFEETDYLDFKLEATTGQLAKYLCGLHNTPRPYSDHGTFRSSFLFIGVKDQDFSSRDVYSHFPKPDELSGMILDFTETN
ncbi:hypothetical protein GEMRC1_002825 [Eukaryota sp. GEM-RC1]